MAALPPGHHLLSRDDAPVHAVVRPLDDGRRALVLGAATVALSPFFRARRAAEEGAFGLGLGLAIVHRVCEACGWRIEVTSSDEAGTCFSVTLAK